MSHWLRRFPFQVALVALLFYALTMSRGVTIGSLALTSKIAGWDWLPLTGQPLLWLLTLPLRLLPAGWVPAGLNLFFAVAGAVTLGILAWSLELLPWFRPLATRKGWSGRLPLLLAIAGCGLEFDFWQAATAATGEMLDVLLLAAAAGCLLKYRVVLELRWLWAAALIWGIGMAENWVMVITLPLFVVSLVWLRGLFFFNRQFILTLAGLGLAGFALYALLPLVNGLLPGSPWNLHLAWLQSLRETKVMLLGIYGQFWVRHRMLAVAVVLFYLLPLAALLVRLGYEDTKNKSPLDRSLIWIFRGVDAGLMLVFLWQAFDPAFGLRQLMARQLNATLPLLTLDYLNALAIGFLAGNLLLALQPREVDEIFDPPIFGRQLAAGLERAAVPGLMVLLVVAALGLGARNLPAITLANRHPLTQFGELELRSLPAGGGLVVSDFPEKLEVFQAAQARHQPQADWLPVLTKDLPEPAYRGRLNRLRPGCWLAATNGQALAPGEMLQLLERLAQTNRIFYIHPSFGYFFEQFYAQPAGLAYELKRYPANTINPPPLTADIIAQNEQVWNGLAPEIESLERLDSAAESSLVKFARKHFDLEPVGVRQSGLLKEWYSLALDDWGVQLQRNGWLSAAQQRFNQALVLNQNNWIVRLNLYCNTNLQTGTNLTLAGVSELDSHLGSLQNRTRLISRLGPVDEPDWCFLLGKTYLHDGLPRLAMQQFDRVHALAPQDLATELALAELYGRYRMNDRAMTAINELRGEIKKRPDNADLDVQLALVEAGVWLAQTNLPRAVSVLQDVVQQHPDDNAAWSRISLAYFTFGDFTNAAQLASRLLAREPDNVAALLIQSGVFLQSRRAELAIPLLNHVLSLTNNLQAKLDRAMAYAATSNYPAARSDYLELESSLPHPLPNMVWNNWRNFSMTPIRPCII